MFFFYSLFLVFYIQFSYAKPGLMSCSPSQKCPENYVCGPENQCIKLLSNLPVYPTKDSGDKINDDNLKKRHVMSYITSYEGEEEDDDSYDTEDIDDYDQKEQYRTKDDQKHIHDTFKEWLKFAHEGKKNSNRRPFHLDMYRIKMSKHGHDRKTPKKGSNQVNDEDQLINEGMDKMKTYRSLGRKLVHLDEMKNMLMEKLDIVKKQESKIKTSLHGEVSEKDRDDGGRGGFHMAKYEPLPDVGDIDTM